MPHFANDAAFNQPRSRMQAMGADLSESRAIVDQHGQVLAYAGTGGMIAPQRFELHPNSTIYRFGSRRKSARDVATGGWWIERREFEKLVNFANTQEILINLAMRLLCLVPPEFSDPPGTVPTGTVLVRARVARSLLAWRGLGNSVFISDAAGREVVRLPHQNEISARRLHQLFIPGLNDLSGLDPAISIENVYQFNPTESKQGFLYL